MEIKKRTITFGKMLEFIDNFGKDYFPLTKYDEWKRVYSGSFNLKSLEHYFPSHIERAVAGLLRKGWVEKVETNKGTMVKITKFGQMQILQYDLEKMALNKDRWDGKWRIIFFDIIELDRKKRNNLRKYLRKLGLYPMQESVYVSPYDCDREIQYLREILDVPHSVKIGVLEQLENSEDLKKIFKL